MQVLGAALSNPSNAIGGSWRAFEATEPLWIFICGFELTYFPAWAAGEVGFF